MQSSAPRKESVEQELPIVSSFRLLDPLLQFLTKRLGKTSVPLKLLKNILPAGFEPQRHQLLLCHISELDRRGILQISTNGKGLDASSSPLSWDDPRLEVGFPTPPNQEDSDYSERQPSLKERGWLSGSTKTAAKRRLAALKRSLKSETSRAEPTNCTDWEAEKTIISPPNESAVTGITPGKDWGKQPEKIDVDFQEELSDEGKAAFEAFHSLLNFKKSRPREHNNNLSKNSIPEHIISRQAAYAGSHPVQKSRFGVLASDVEDQIPRSLLAAFGLGPITEKRLYSHQATAVNAAVRDIHTLICTSTGSGKSLCFLLPALAAAYNAGVVSGQTSRGISLVMFPTKALAQDQLSKLQSMLSQYKDLQELIIPATLDGDCSHEQRMYAAKHANIILTNPDTIHASVLPNWEKSYKRVLTQLRYVVIDEAHVYEGVFGAHVALTLSRLYRLCVAATSQAFEKAITPTFLASSATLAHPEHHMRLLCPISKREKLTILTAGDDGSPRSAKHFFVWNPPLLAPDGTSAGFVDFSAETKRNSSVALQQSKERKRGRSENFSRNFYVGDNGSQPVADGQISMYEPRLEAVPTSRLHRRHAADETALLLARAIVNNVRCIAFCKTRMVVECVYERTVAVLKSDKATKHLASKVEPYRGGYKLCDRREIEKKLFQKELLGVVATSALELGVDIGGIDLTLHTGYPASISSLLQQAGRAGRHKRLDSPSLSVVVSFGSPAEQHLWRRPKCLLTRGISSPISFPMNPGITQGHLLCASKEFPLTGKFPVSVLRGTVAGRQEILPDFELFGSNDNFAEALSALFGNGSLVRFSAALPSGRQLLAFKAHAFIDKPWARVSIRSIEPINFSIVDLSYPAQAGKMDCVHDEKAVLDVMPYSRVFYHCHPGAIILHRGKKYKILSMTRPPRYDPSIAYKGNMDLAAFAKPTKEKYFTRPLSTNTITVVKQLERVDIEGRKLPLPDCDGRSIDVPAKNDEHLNVTDEPAGGDSVDLKGSFAGCGIVTAKRTVHGYKKISMVTRAEMSRHDLSLPAMEYDTFGLWIDAEAGILSNFLGPDFGSGVHALSHALLAVAPLFIPCVRSDLECDHSAYSPTRVCLFDERAGGSGTCAELWRSLFIPDGLLVAAIRLLEDCSSCSEGGDGTYDGGCPACLQSGQCVKFNQFLSRSAALIIARRMLKRLQQSDLYMSNIAEKVGSTSVDGTENKDMMPLEGREDSPRKKARTQALRNAKSIQSARERLFVVGRPTWFTDDENMPGGRQVTAD